jgi:hypothetical protein
MWYLYQIYCNTGDHIGHVFGRGSALELFNRRRVGL